MRHSNMLLSNEENPASFNPARGHLVLVESKMCAIMIMHDVMMVGGWLVGVVGVQTPIIQTTPSCMYEYGIIICTSFVLFHNAS